MTNEVPKPETQSMATTTDTAELVAGLNLSEREDRKELVRRWRDRKLAEALIEVAVEG